MAKAQFHRNQKVWVESVGAWATVDKIVPVWAKGFDEPVKITYDVGLGRAFAASELRPAGEDGGADEGLEGWRVLRAQNKWQTAADTAHHPYPGTYPVVVTDPKDWGGWRTPGAEYDRDPDQIERQARLIVKAPVLLKIARDLLDLVAEAPDDAPPSVQALARRAAAVLRDLADTAPAQARAEEMAES